MTQSHRVLYRQSRFPVLQNRLFHSREAALQCATGDICLVQDHKTGLISNSLFDRSLLEYDAHYHNEQEHSAAFKQHLAMVGDLVERCLGKEELVEVGCGKGYFLEQMSSRGCTISGFDPTYEGTNPLVVKSFVTDSTALNARGVILRHVLEHIPGPVEFLAHLRDANAGTGRIYIEVPCFDWICSQRAWFDIFYEHVNYFRLEDFHRLFDKVVDSGRIFGGQYLYCVAELGSLRDTPRDGWSLANLPPDFLPARAGGEANVGEGALPSEAIWGCGSKGVIFALLRERAGRPVRVAIDINPHKQNMHLPATGIQVLSPAAGLAALPRGSTIYVMNPMYATEIKQLGGDAHDYMSMSAGM